LFEAMVMSAGQRVQQALSNPVVVQVMKADAAKRSPEGSAVMPASAASPSPNGRDPNDKKKLRQRLIEAMINVGGSLAGDALEHVTGGRPLSADRMATGTVIAASLGFALPPGMRGLLKGSLVNGLGSAGETGLRQLSGVDSSDPLAILASFVFSTGATAGVHGLTKAASPPLASQLDRLRNRFDPAQLSPEKKSDKPKPNIFFRSVVTIFHGTKLLVILIESNVR
jgi:hypothetical protein